MKIIYLLVHEHKFGETIVAFEKAEDAFALLKEIMTGPEYLRDKDQANVQPIQLK